MQFSSAPKPAETNELEKVELDCVIHPSSWTVGDDQAIKWEKGNEKVGRNWSWYATMNKS